MIRLICFNIFDIEDEKYIPLKVHELKVAFYVLKQGRDSDQIYQTKLLNIVQVIERCGASLVEDSLTREAVCKVLGYRSNTTAPAQKAEITKKVKEGTLRTALILGASDPAAMCESLRRACRESTPSPGSHELGQCVLGTCWGSIK